MLGLRNRHFFAIDILALSLMPALAVTLRLERLDWWYQFGRAVILFTCVTLLIKLPTFYGLSLYNSYWRYMNIHDVAVILAAVGFSTVILTIGFVVAHPTLEPHGLAMYRTVPLLDGLLTGLAVAGPRLGLRWLYHRASRDHKAIGGRRVLVVGAGEAGKMVVREMQANPQLDMEPVAFVDDDMAKSGLHIENLPVLGNSADIPHLVDRHHIRRIVVAVPSAPLGRLQEIMALCEQTGLPTDNVPGMYEILAGSKTVSRRSVFDANRLLRRAPVVIEQAEISECLSGATVLVTGAGGSIGSELCRQVARVNPKELILLGHGENSIFEINLDLRLSFPNLNIQPVIADVRDRERINQIVARYRPDAIFHTAAHKHVPLMEANVEEAITNNVVGTFNVLQAAKEYDVHRFVLISTDKAVNPTSIMGMTKRLAELLTMEAAHSSGQAYLAVRFGNVLGSRGSVIPVFQRQIAAGGPVTITHPDMRRYFMTISEAVQLVLQATVLGRGGEVFALDMGEPVRILDLATDLIKLSGLKPGRDIQITYIGTRPGEKLSEELFLDTENYQPTKHPRILVTANGHTVEAATVTRLVNLANQTRVSAEERMRTKKAYQPPKQTALQSPKAVSADVLSLPIG